MAKPKIQAGKGSSHSFIESALRTLEVEAGGITALAAAIHDGLGRSFIAAVELIRSAKGRVIVTGMGKSGHVARKVAATFASTGTPAFFVHPGEASHGDLGMITPDDVIMALSWSGETAELRNLIDYSRRFRIGLVADHRRGRQHARQGRRRGAGAAAGARSLPAQSRAHHLVADATCARRRAGHRAAGKPRLHRRRFRHAASRRPARRAAEIRARRHAHAATPCRWFAPARKMSDAVLEMSAKGFGCVGITDGDGKLVGIITDGDLRRHMRPDLLDARVDEVMTRRPKTMRPDQLVSEALEMLNAIEDHRAVRGRGRSSSPKRWC